MNYKNPYILTICLQFVSALSASVGSVNMSWSNYNTADEYLKMQREPSQHFFLFFLFAQPYLTPSLSFSRGQTYHWAFLVAPFHAQICQYLMFRCSRVRVKRSGRFSPRRRRFDNNFRRVQPCSCDRKNRCEINFIWIFV